MPPLENDRILAPDLARAARLVAMGALAEATDEAQLLELEDDA